MLYARRPFYRWYKKNLVPGGHTGGLEDLEVQAAIESKRTR
jgi:hypothetical protein